MPRMGFEPTTPVFKRAKTVHALDGAATVIGLCTLPKILINVSVFYDATYAT
jgi:hypothetical protein